jgi:hypothetical protein
MMTGFVRARQPCDFPFCHSDSLNNHPRLGKFRGDLTSQCQIARRPKFIHGNGIFIFNFFIQTVGQPESLCVGAFGEKTLGYCLVNITDSKLAIIY